jgi:hypothetical protein
LYWLKSKSLINGMFKFHFNKKKKKKRGGAATPWPGVLPATPKQYMGWREWGGPRHP